MAQISLPSTDAVPVQTSTAKKTARLFFIDHLRAALMILVVVHHVALVYGASVEGYYYVEPPFTSPQAFRNLLVLALVNQGWFMGAFFLLSGYFTPRSFDRKGAGSFLKDRLIRLGIPLIVFTFILSPIASLGWYLMPSAMTGITTAPSWERYPDMIGIGPLWFVLMLFIFCVGYAVWRQLTGSHAPAEVRKPSSPSYLWIAVFTLALAVVSYLFRMIVPLGEGVSLGFDWVHFPTIAYLPQYLSFFVVGIVASRYDWFRTLPDSMGVVGLVVAAVAGLVLFPLAFSGQWFSLELTEALDNAMGNGHWQSAVYALWDSTFAVGLCLGLIPLFRRFVNGQGGFGRFMSQNSYAVYVIHIPIIVFLAYALRGVELATMLKFGLASLIIVPVCFLVAFVLRKIPYVSKVL